MNKVQKHQRQSTTVRDIIRRARGPQYELNEARNEAAAFFGQFPQNIDLQECLNIQRRAEENFERFSPEVKQRFGYQPQQLINFIQDDSNYEEAVKLGIISIESQKARETIKRLEEQKAFEAEKQASEAGKRDS